MLPNKLICFCMSGKRWTACCGNSEKKAKRQIKLGRYVTVPREKLTHEFAKVVKHWNEDPVSSLFNIVDVEPVSGD